MGETLEQRQIHLNAACSAWNDLGWGNACAGATVSLFTMPVTLSMLGVGSVAESFGLGAPSLLGSPAVGCRRSTGSAVPSRCWPWS